MPHLYDQLIANAFDTQTVQYRGISYNIDHAKTAQWQGKTVYLAIGDTGVYNFFQKLIFRIVSIVLSLFDPIASTVWQYKGMLGKHVITVIKPAPSLLQSTPPLTPPVNCDPDEKSSTGALAKTQQATREFLLEEEFHNLIQLKGEKQAIEEWQPLLEELDHALVIYKVTKNAAWALKIGDIYKDLSHQTDENQQKHRAKAIQYLKEGFDLYFDPINKVELSSASLLDISSTDAALTLAELYIMENQYEKADNWLRELQRHPSRTLWKEPERVHTIEFRILVNKKGEKQALQDWCSHQGAIEPARALAMYQVIGGRVLAKKVALAYKACILTAIDDEDRHIYQKKAAAYFEKALENLDQEPDPESGYDLWELYNEKALNDPGKAFCYLSYAASRGHLAAARQCVIDNFNKEKGERAQNFWEKHWGEKYAKAKMQSLVDKVEKLGGVLLDVATNDDGIIDAEFVRYKLSIELEKKDLFNRLKHIKAIPNSESFDVKPTRGGVCGGMVLEFMSCCLSLPASMEKLEPFLKEIASRYQYCSRIKAIALQHLYTHISGRISASKHHLPNKKRSDNDYASLCPLYRLQNQQPVLLLDFGIPGELNDLACAQKWVKEAPDGCYELTLKVQNSYHVMAVIKQERQVYLWDPTYGLINCSRSDPAKIIACFLSDFWGSLDNHAMEFRHIQSLPLEERISYY